MIYYVHGFASCAHANEDKINDLYTIFPSEDVQCLEYDSTNDFNENMHILINQVTQGEDNFFIGTSLGGYYAYNLANHFKCMSVALFNPCVSPYDIIDSRTTYKNYCTGMSFNVSDPVRRSYRNLKKLNSIATWVFRGINDTLTNWNDEFFNSCKELIIPEGHRISSFIPYENELREARNHFAI